MATKSRLKVAVADDERDMREYFKVMLPELGYDVPIVAETGRQLVEACVAHPPDLVITDIKMPDMDGLEAAERIFQAHPLPVIVVTAYDRPEFLARAEEGPVLGYLVKPIKQSDLVPAISLALRRFDQLQGLRKEAGDLRQALEDRKVIERAKGVVMHRLQVDEREAFRRMQKYSTDQNRKMIDVAQAILKAEEVLQPLERH